MIQKPNDIGVWERELWICQWTKVETSAEKWTVIEMTEDLEKDGPEVQKSQIKGYI